LKGVQRVVVKGEEKDIDLDTYKMFTENSE
jgi:hypothetical protein